MNIFKNDFEKRWSDLSQDVKKLNEYTKVHPVELRNVKAVELNLEGVIFSGSNFSDVIWEQVDASKAALTKVVFKDCKFIGGNWEEGILTDVLFENCEFLDMAFSSSTMTNVRFKNCRMKRTGIGYLKGGTVNFDGCHWEMGVGGMSSCHFEFRNCNIDGVMFLGMKNSVPLLIEDSLLNEVDFSKSHFSTVTLRRVKQGERPVRFNSSVVDTFSFDNVDMTRGVSLAYVKANLVRITGGRFGAAFEGSMIDKVLAQGAFLANIDFSEATMPHVDIANCELYDLAIWDSIIEELSIMASTINIIDATGLKGEIILWDNVTLDGKIDLTNAQVKDFRPTRLKRGPRLNLITTGSNIKF